MTRLGDEALERLDKDLKRTRLVGQTLDGRYRIEAEIGRGGMAEVFRAHDLKLPSDVAVKVMSRSLSSQILVTMFQREALAVATLVHPNVITIHDVGQLPDGRLYYCMNYVEGRTLEELVRSGESERELIRTLIVVCEAVHFAHERGVIHRDLKPSNIMRDSQGRIYVLDWGLAAFLEGQAREEAPPDGDPDSSTVMGTPQYMSPEQVQGRPPDRRTDVYSLGVIPHFIAAKRAPFFARPTSALLEAILHEEPSPLPDRDLDAIRRRAMAKRPEDRYATAEMAAADLRRYLEGDPVSARTLSVRERVWRRARKRPRPAALFLTALLAIGTLGGMLWKERRSNADREARRGRVREHVALARGHLEQADNALGAEDLSEVEPLLQRANEEADRALAEDASTAEAHLLRGRILRRRRDHRGAEEALERAIRLDPRFGSAYRERGLIALDRMISSMGSLVSVSLFEGPSIVLRADQVPAELIGRADFETVARLLNDERERVLVDGILEFLRGNREGACAKLQEAARIDSTVPLPFLLQAAALFQFGRKKEAEAMCRMALRRGPLDSSVWLLPAAILQAEGQAGEALSACERAVRLRPAAPEPYVHRAGVRAAMGRFAEAKEELDRALETGWGPALYVQRAYLAMELGDAGAALEDLQRAKERGERGFLAAMFEAFLRAEEGSPYAMPGDELTRLREHFFLRGMLYRQMGRSEEALKDIGRAVREDPKTVYRAEMARLLADLGRVDEAMAEAKLAREQAPQDAEAAHALGWARFRAGDLHGAVAEFTRAASLRPQDPRHVYARGKAHSRAGRYREAAADFETAMDLGILDPEPFLSKAVLHESFGQSRQRTS